MSQFQKLPRLLGETEPLPYVALFHSTIRKQEHMHENLMAVRAPFEGMFRVLERAHIPFTIVTERDILQNKLKNFESLVIPGTECIADGVAEKINSFVSQGGGIVSTFSTSFKDELGKERKTPALADVFGIKNITGGRRCCATYDGYDYGWPSINVPANLFKVTPRHPVTRELLMDCLYAYTGGLIYTKMGADSEPLLHTILYDDKLANSGRFFRYMHEEKLAVVETLMGTEPKLRKVNGKLEITIPKIEEGEVIALLPV